VERTSAGDERREHQLVKGGENISWLRVERTSAGEERREHQLVMGGENISW
jgi:hypothetical protein